MFYKYTVSYYDTHIDEEQTDTGIVFAESFGKAAERVTEEYGEYAFEVTIREMVVEENSFCLNKEDIDYAFSHD